MINKFLAIFAKARIYIFNTSWIIGEKLLQLLAGFLVVAVVAKYLGPEKFGVLSYATSMVAILASAGHMGLSGLVVRELISSPKEEGLVLGTSILLKFIGVLIGFLTILLLGFYTKSSHEEFLILVVVALTLFFKPLEVINFWFESRIKSKYVAIANGSALIVSSVLKLLLVFLGAGIIFFAVAHVIQVVLACIILIFFFSYRSLSGFSSWNFSVDYAKNLLAKGWVIFLGSIFSVIYLKVDQVMLKWMVGAEEVGVYAVAATLSELWYFIPTAIVTSFFPRLIKLKDQESPVYIKRYQQIFDLLFIIALCVALVVTVFSEIVIKIFFGADYLASAEILVIHVWSAVFIFMRAAFSKWIIIEGALVFSLITQASGALINVLLNLVLIPLWGGKGAAIATLVSYAFASYFSLAIYRKTRIVFWMMSLAMMSPFRYASALLRKR